MTVSPLDEWLGGFWEFYRAYTRTGVHAAAAAALTALGLLTFLHRGFVVLALAAYVLPPLYLYATRGESGEELGREAANERHEGTGERADTGQSTTGTASAGARIGRGWTAAESPTDALLTDVVPSRSGPYAVGEGGAVLARSANGWEHVLRAGPTASSNDLRGAAVSADGLAVWFAGDGGVVGRYDVREERLTDHSAPDDRTGTWEDVAVAGAAGEETVYLVNGSGEVLRGEHDGGAVGWGTPAKPGSGSSMTSVAFDDGRGYLCDTDETVYETTDGDRYEVVGIDGADTDLLSVATVDADTVVVAGGDGTVFRYDRPGWTPRRVSEEALLAVDGDGGVALAAGEDGMVFRFAQGNWDAEETRVELDLHGVALGGDGPDVAVGEDGCILERRG